VAQADSQALLETAPFRMPHVVPAPHVVTGVLVSHIVEVQYPPGAFRPRLVAAACVRHVAVPAMVRQSAVL
jgi:hypothetical protein